MAKRKKALIKQFEDIVADEALEAATMYDVKYKFHDYSGEVQTVYVVECEDTANPVEFYMLKNLEKRLKEVGFRYQVGIIHEELPAEDEEE